MNRREALAALIGTLGILSLVLIGRTTSEPDTLSQPTTNNKRASSAIALTADGALLLAVNPDSNSLTLIDTADPTQKAELTVGIDPRTVTVNDAGDIAYVASRGSDSVSVIDLSSQQVTAEIPVGYRPYGVLVSPDGKRLYVAEQGEDRIRILDTTTYATVARVPVTDRPSGLALSDDGRTLLITHLLSNQITFVNVSHYHQYLPLIMQASGSSQSSVASVGSSFAASYPQHLVSLFGQSNLVQSIVIGPGGQFAYVPHTRSNTTNRALGFSSTVIPLVSIVDLDSESHMTGQQFALGTLDPPGVGLPFDAAVTPDGGELWVVNAASNDISVVDLATRQLAAHIEVGDNPRGIVLSPDGSTAYVNNTLAGSVSVIDTAAYTVTQSIETTDIPLPPLLLTGKRLFHSSDDPRMSLDQWIACNSCHFEGEHDGRTWFFGFAGPRNTTSLLGMIQTYPLRWSGEWDESADSEFVIRRENFGTGLIAGAVNCGLSPVDCVHQPPNQGRETDLDALAAFMDSLAMPPSPEHRHGEPLTAAEQRGRAIFHDPSLGCLTCHPPPLYTDHLAHDVGTATADEKIGPAYDTPTLRGLYDSAPYFHDGSAATLYEMLTRPTPNGEHDVRAMLTDAEIQDLIAYMLALPLGGH